MAAAASRIAALTASAQARRRGVTSVVMGNLSLSTAGRRAGRFYQMDPEADDAGNGATAPRAEPRRVRDALGTGGVVSVGRLPGPSGAQRTTQRDSHRDWRGGAGLFPPAAPRMSVVRLTNV